MMQLLEFEPLHESVGHYVLPGDIHVHVRYLLSFAWQDGDDPKRVELRAVTHLGVFAPLEMKRTGTKPPRLPPREASAAEIRVQREAWSLYRFSDGRMLELDFRIMKARFTGNYSDDGEPIYEIEHTATMRPIPASESQSRGTQADEHAQGARVEDSPEPG